MNNNEAVEIFEELLEEVYVETTTPYISNRRLKAIQYAIAILEKDTKIKCKDCKHFGIMRCGVDVGGYCMKLEYTTREPNDFCSWAEEGDNEYQRKKGGDNG